MTMADTKKKVKDNSLTENKVSENKTSKSTPKKKSNETTKPIQPVIQTTEDTQTADIVTLASQQQSDTNTIVSLDTWLWVDQVSETTPSIEDIIPTQTTTADPIDPIVWNTWNSHSDTIETNITHTTTTPSASNTQSDIQDPFYQVWPQTQIELVHKPINIDNIINETLNTNTVDASKDITIDIQTSLQWWNLTQTPVSWAQTSNHGSLNQHIDQLTKPSHHSVIWLLFALLGFISLIWWWFLVYKMMFNTDSASTEDNNTISTENIDAQFISGDITDISTGIIPIVDAVWTSGSSASWTTDPFLDNIGDQIDQGEAILATQESAIDSQKDTQPQLDTQKDAINYLTEFQMLLTEAESGYQYTDLKWMEKANKLYKLIRLKIQNIITKLENGEVIDKNILSTDFAKYKKYLQKAQKLSQI